MKLELLCEIGYDKVTNLYCQSDNCSMFQKSLYDLGVDIPTAYYLFYLIDSAVDREQAQSAARNPDARFATEQGSVPDPTALEPIFVVVKKNCSICHFDHDDSPVGPCLKCAQDTMSGFKLSSTLTERSGR
jgi:hypothetical protein